MTFDLGRDSVEVVGVVSVSGFFTSHGVHVNGVKIRIE